MWTWIGTMTPHKLTWGFAYNSPIAQWVAIALLAGFAFTSDRKPLPRTRETSMLFGLWGIFTLTTVFAIAPDMAWIQWERVSKIFLITWITLLLFQDRSRIRYLILVIAGSIGFFGVKGGIWAL